MKTIALILDGAPGDDHHDLSAAALEHSIASTAVRAVVDVVQTADLPRRRIDEFDGLMVGPGSPYDDPEAVIDWIRTARERGVPLVGT